MGLLDGLLNRVFLVNGVESIQTREVDFVGASGAVSGGVLRINVGGLTLTSVKTLPYTAAFGEHVRSDAADVTLPLAAGQVNGRVGVLLTTANAIAINRSGSDTINGATSLALSGAYDSVILQSDGVSSWYIVTRVNAGV